MRGGIADKALQIVDRFHKNPVKKLFFVFGSWVSLRYKIIYAKLHGRHIARYEKIIYEESKLLRIRLAGELKSLFDKFSNSDLLFFSPG